MNFETIKMEIASNPQYVSVIRLTTSGIANKIGFCLEDIEDIKVEVIEEPNKGFLGFIGAKDGLYKITVTEKVEIIEEVEPVKEIDIAKEFIETMLHNAKINADVIATQENNLIKIDIKGKEATTLIGRRGQTLDAVQFLTSLALNKINKDSHSRVLVDIENYREKREKTLEILGRKLAFKAVKTGRKTNLEPMNPYERRIIHTSVQKVNGAISWSEGENANRHVVIGPDPKAKPVRRNGGYNNRGRGGRRPYSANRSEHNTPANPDRKPLNEGGATGLYGRIDK